MYHVCGSHYSNQVTKEKPAGFHILLGTFQHYNEALEFQMRLSYQGIKSNIITKARKYYVVTEPLNNLEEAAFYEHYLRHLGFNTMLLL